MTESPPPSRPKHKARYGFFTLGWLRDEHQVSSLRVVCLNPKCRHWLNLGIQDAITLARAEGAHLGMLARRVRCKQCGRLGAHIEPMQPVPPYF